MGGGDTRGLVQEPPRVVHAVPGAQEGLSTEQAGFGATERVDCLQRMGPVEH